MKVKVFFFFLKAFKLNIIGMKWHKPNFTKKFASQLISNLNDTQ